MSITNKKVSSELNLIRTLIKDIFSNHPTERMEAAQIILEDISNEIDIIAKEALKIDDVQHQLNDVIIKRLSVMLNSKATRDKKYYGGGVDEK